MAAVAVIVIGGGTGNNVTAAAPEADKETALVERWGVRADGR